MSFSEEEINEFKIEARELLDTAENSLLNLDQGDNFKQTYDALFRCFHNLKGASGIMEMHDLQKHTHELETVLMPFKNQPKMEKSYISYFLRGIDAARVILDGGAINFDYQSFREESPNSIKSEKELSKSAIDEFIAESEEVISRIAAILPVMESGSVNRSMLDEFFRDVHSLKGSSFIFGIQSMGNLAHAMESALEPIRNQTHQPNKSLGLIYSLLRTSLRRQLTFLPKVWQSAAALILWHYRVSFPVSLYKSRSNQAACLSMKVKSSC